jgi:hypothetical protein
MAGRRTARGRRAQWLAVLAGAVIGRRLDRLDRLAARAAAVVALAAAILAGCGGGSSAYPVQTTASPRARVAGPPPRIAVIVMENREYSDVVAQRDTPYISGLARRSALATRMYAITHPSLPNYLALTGGSTFGIDSDCTGCSVPGTGLAGQLAGHGISWRAYIEKLPRPCFRGGGAGDYAKKHNPFLYYRGIVADASLCAGDVPLKRLRADEAAGTLPRFLWISPDLCHDGHDCGNATADRFLAGFVPGLLRALGPRGLLIITWDEGTSDDGCCRLARGGHIATILAGPLARPGARLRTPVDHYSVLQTIEDLLGVPRMRGAACACTPSLAPLLRR